jgi:hypothetical protein
VGPGVGGEGLGIGGEGLGCGSVGPGEGSGSWFVSTQSEIGCWRTSIDKTMSSIIPCFMISPSPTAKLPFRRGARCSALTLLYDNKHVEVCLFNIAHRFAGSSSFGTHPFDRAQAGVPYFLPVVLLGTHPAINPPSMGRMLPVVQRDSSDAK